MEYRNIINNLKFGSIESDNEIVELYQELLNAISSKRLTQESAAKLRAVYDQREKRNIASSSFSVADIAQGFGSLSENAGATNNLAIGSLTVPQAALVAVTVAFAGACISEYMAWQDAKLRRELSSDLWKIEK